jgi:1L-myo-inositol 1-phosphate cytidylyltransferase
MTLLHGFDTRPIINEAVILMAGSGSRVRANGIIMPKPLIEVAGRPLFAHTVNCLKEAGIRRLHVVTGYNSDALLAGLEPLMPVGMELHPIHNLQWTKKNGISLLSAAGHVSSPFLLTMGDHFFDPAIIDLLIAGADLTKLNLAVDRKIETVFDIDDAMKVRTRGTQLIAIGKDLEDYNAIDTGVFVCPPEIFEYFETAGRSGDCSLADGVQLMAQAGKVNAIDIGNAWWHDIDTAEMLKHAEAMPALRADGIAIPHRSTL